MISLVTSFHLNFILILITSLLIANAYNYDGIINKAGYRYRYFASLGNHRFSFRNYTIVLNPQLQRYCYVGVLLTL